LYKILLRFPIILFPQEKFKENKMARRKDLLSEAIADAKAVKETALANAKLALEEAFTPKLQSMISAKLAEEADEEEVEEELDSSDLGSGDNAQPDADAASSSDIENDDELTEEEDEEVSEEEDVEETYEGEEEVAEEGWNEEEVAEEDSEEDEVEEEDEYEEDEEDDLDLESVIAELEAELEEEDEEVSEEEDSEVSEEEDMDVEEDMDEEEEIDLDEVIRTLKEMEGDEIEEEEVDEEEVEEDNHAEELEEAYATIESLRKTINEVNLLNAKLLYTNKLFRTFDLNEGQKVKVLENFDRTSSVREVKLVFSTLAENLNVAKKRKAVVKEGYASKATKSSAPKKQIISEGNEMAARWKKLAGLK
jgi:hypothetical protein